MANQPTVWFLVLNYCSLSDTLYCVDHIRKIPYNNKKLLVLDNSSPDGSGAELARCLPNDEFVQLPSNTGYAGGNNEGIQRAINEGADYVFIVNPDVRLAPDCIDTYLEIFSQDENIGAINSIQVSADSRTIDYNFLTGLLVPAGYTEKILTTEYYSKSFYADALFGAALMISVKAINRVGGFDPLYFAYGEEVDLCRRMRYHGFKLVITPRSPVRHLRTQYQNEVSDFVLFLKLKGFYLGQIKDPNKPFYLGLYAILRDFYGALTKREPKHYPFDRYHIKRRHVVQATIWFLLHMYKIWRHRGLEKSGRAHI